MPESENAGRSLSQRLTGRVGNPLEWSYVDRTLLLAGFVLSMNIPFTLFLHLGSGSPGFPPAYLNQAMYRVGVQTQWAFIGLFALFFGIGAMTRRTHPGNRWLPYGLAVSIAVHDAWLLGGLGHSTNPATFLCLFLMAFIGLFLFDLQFTLWVIASWIVVLGAGITTEQLGWAPYAPALARPPFMNGRIDPWWMVISFAVSGLVTALMLVLFGYVLSRWRRREAEVTELSEFLKKMFGRYFSPEVMKSLLEDPAAMELGGERRAVTIMMTDLRGFTALSERLEPEQVVQMLNTYFEVMVDVILKYNGTINEILGDALLVVFGAPREMFHRARQAVACAIEMQNAVKQVNEKNRNMGLPELEMGIGLNDAEVVVGNIGSSKRSKYAVVGSGVNMTSRIESYAVGAQILISETVRREAGEILRIDGQTDVVPKGAETPIRIYEIGGIAGDYNLALEEEDPELVTLSRPIPFEYSVLEGKHEGRAGLGGFVVRLSKKGAELDTEESIGLMTDIRMRLRGVDEILSGKEFYGKVIEGSSESGKGCVIRFTSLPPEVGAYLQAHRQFTS